MTQHFSTDGFMTVDYPRVESNAADDNHATTSLKEIKVNPQMEHIKIEAGNGDQQYQGSFESKEDLLNNKDSTLTSIKGSNYCESSEKYSKLTTDVNFEVALNPTASAGCKNGIQIIKKNRYWITITVLFMIIVMIFLAVHRSNIVDVSLK